MYNFLVKNGQTVAFGLGVLIVGAFLASVFGGMESFSTASEEAQYESGIFDLGIRGAVALAFIAAIAMVGFGLFHIATNFKGSLKGIIGFAILIVIFVVAYSAADTSITPSIATAIEKFETAQGSEITEGTLRYMSGGITTMLALLGIAVVSFVAAEIRNFFK
ncbi:MAG: hypothetical protein MRY78_11855 [Saprospiraceae bacterium]|nr:hypothetical protein [Saprospiraceae bacterium]